MKPMPALVPAEETEGHAKPEIQAPNQPECKEKAVNFSSNSLHDANPSYLTLD
jgi:hypothetical protein